MKRGIASQKLSRKWQKKIEKQKGVSEEERFTTLL